MVRTDRRPVVERLARRERGGSFRRFSITAALLALLVDAPAARVQETTAGTTLPQELGEAARARLAQPAMVERVNERPSGGRLARLIEDLHVQFKVFEGDEEGDFGLGIAYDLVKTLLTMEDAGGGAAELVANGNLATDQDVNPDDFLWTALRLRWSGTRALGPGETREGLAGTLADPQGEMLAALDPERFAALSARFAREPASAIRSDAEYQTLARSYFATIERDLPPELAWNFDLHAGLESNQDFSSRQVVLGAALGGRLVSWDPEAALSRYNLFDAPAAAVRWLAGEDEVFRTSGEAYPTIVAGLDLVDAAREETRGAATDDESFLRARFEAGLASHVVTVGDEPLSLSAGWRFYQELDAPADVRQADTDRHSHLEIRLDLPLGWSLTYATGKLPLDARNDSTFALGFNVQF